MLVAYQNLLVGTSTSLEDRAMKGYIASFKIWNKALTVEEIAQIDMMEDTKIQSANVLREVQIRDQDSLNALGTLVGSNYSFELIEQ